LRELKRRSETKIKKIKVSHTHFTLFILFLNPIFNVFAADESTDDDGEDDGSNEEFNESSIIGLIDVMCILLSGNKTKFKAPQNVAFWEEIKSSFHKTCSLFFRYFKVSLFLFPSQNFTLNYLSPYYVLRIRTVSVRSSISMD
jgi:hypothetical protein